MALQDRLPQFQYGDSDAVHSQLCHKRFPMDAEPVGAGSHNPMVHRDTHTCTHLLHMPNI